MVYYTTHVEIYERGRYLRRNTDNALVTVDYVELTTKGGKLVYKVYDTAGRVYNAEDLH